MEVTSVSISLSSQKHHPNPGTNYLTGEKLLTTMQIWMKFMFL